MNETKKPFRSNSFEYIVILCQLWFTENDIDGDAFAMLYKEAVKELVTAVGLRLKFESAFSRLSPPSQNSLPLTGTADVDDKEKGDASGKPVAMIQGQLAQLDDGFVQEHSKIFGHKNPTAKLTDWQVTVNSRALELATLDRTLLFDRGTLKHRAEEKARET